MRNRYVALLGAIFGIALFAAPAVSFAQAWYIGGAVGSSNVSVNGFDDDDIGFKLFGGYQFNPSFGAEAGYVDLGTFGTSPFDVGVNGGALGVWGAIPFSENFDVHGNVGAYFWNADNGGFGTNDSGTDVYFGVGVGFRLNETVKLVGDWNRYKVDEADIDLYSIGISVDLH